MTPVEKERGVGVYILSYSFDLATPQREYRHLVDKLDFKEQVRFSIGIARPTCYSRFELSARS
jgi:hypothetical protein